MQAPDWLPEHDGANEKGQTELEVSEHVVGYRGGGPYDEKYGQVDEEGSASRQQDQVHGFCVGVFILS